MTQRYFCPSLAAVTGTLKLELPFPFMDDPLQTFDPALQYCHLYVRPVPDACTVNCAVSPAAPVKSSGCTVISGAPSAILPQFLR